MPITDRLVSVIYDDIDAFFKASHPGVEPVVDIEPMDGQSGVTAVDCVVIANFPVPVHHLARSVPVLLLLKNFPENPPAGLYVPTGHPARPTLAKAFSAFLDDMPYGDVEPLGTEGWTWLCNGFKGDSNGKFQGTWRYSYSTRDGNDSLAFLLANFQAYIYKSLA